MTLSEFKASFAQPTPAADLSAPLQALWWAGKGDWERAHKIVMDDESKEAAWIHAYLHRVEGDLPNARYWYGRAGQNAAEGALDAEWAGLVQHFVSRGSRR